MYSLERAYALSSTQVIERYKHPDHGRTVDLSTMYKAFATGEGLEYMLQRFDLRESEADFKQANRIAQQITKPVTSALMNPARKVPSVRPVVDKVDYGKQDQKSKELRDQLSEWYGGKSVTEYMGTLVDPSDMDPNAFVVLTFDQFDYRKSKPSMFPFMVGCDNVWNFEYVNGELATLFLAFDIQYETKPAQYDANGKVITKAETAGGKRFAMWTAEHHIVYEQIAKEKAPSGPHSVLLDPIGQEVTISKNAGVRFNYFDSTADYFLRQEDDTCYVVRFYEQKSGRVPAFRLGCKPDALTGGRTCVNRWDEAVPYLKKSLKQVRELDLTTALHVFPQKLQYVGPCAETGCRNGYMQSGSECSSCKGTGISTIKTAQDHITLRMPKDPEDAMFDLAKLTHYVQLPVETIQQMRDIVRETRSDCFRAVHGSDLYGQGNVGKTYEEVLAMNEAMYDGLRPFCNWWSDTYIVINHVFANYNDMGEGLNVVHKMPRSLGFETAGNAFAAIKAARDAGASNAITANLNETAIHILFRDDTDALQKTLVQAKFDPFPGMDSSTVTSLISGGKTTDKSALMWAESATVFRKAEEKYPGEVSFYQLDEKKQREVIDQILDEMIKEQEDKAAEMAQQFAPELGVADNIDNNADDQPQDNPDQPPV